jgi:RNA polymerase sigma-70 factor (ECF subfamily)
MSVISQPTDHRQSPELPTPHGPADSAEQAVSPLPGDLPDESFVQSLYVEYRGALLSFVARLNGGDWYWAEDVVQETLLRAWRHTDGLVPGRHTRNMMPWLVTVARRIVINDRRSRCTRPKEIDEALLATIAAPDQTDRALLRAILVDALGRLTPAHRYVVVEMYFRGRTVAEVARAMSIPAGTVKSRLYYAMRAMRKELEQRGVTRGG